ncbi:TRE1 [Linum grandiflorum]
MDNNLSFLLFLLFVPSIFSHPISAATCGGGEGADQGPVVPTTPLLSFLVRLQETALQTLGGGNNFDPKFYVDVSLKFNLSTTQKVFDGLPRRRNGSVPAPAFQRFVTEYLGAAGDGLVVHQPVDFVAEPDGFLPKVKNPKVRAWALEVHSLWKNLSRKVSDEVRETPDLHTLLPLPGPVVIPGSRFREVYYWDSYWVIRGLMASKMYDTAKSIVTNLIYLLDTYGHVLNGARSYYTNRSQPPLLSAMVSEIYNRTGDVKFAMKALPALIKEHEFWTSGQHNITIHDGKTAKHSLSRYYAMWNTPRPESATIDRDSAANISNACEKQKFYREVASTAESGWDFSTRWMRNTSDFTTLSTTSILPVDLNTYLLKLELDIAMLAKVTGKSTIARSFSKASEARKQALKSVFWNAKKGQWFDYWLNREGFSSHAWKVSNQNQNAFASNFVPLWIDQFHSDAVLVEQVLKSFQKSGLIRATGIATSLTNSGQQWDFPNGWAPLQHLIVEGLARSGSKKAKALAEEIAVRWINSNYIVYTRTGAMHEKLDVQACGEFGGGGEYVPQTGFGWTNGVVLAFLEEFGWPHDRELGC